MSASRPAFRWDDRQLRVASPRSLSRPGRQQPVFCCRSIFQHEPPQFADCSVGWQGRLPDRLTQSRISWVEALSSPRVRAGTALLVVALVVVRKLLDQPEGEDDAPDQEEDVMDLHDSLQ